MAAASTLKPIIGDVESFTLMDARRQPAHLQPHREPRAVPPGDRRLWPVRRRHPRAPSADAAHQARARGAGHRHRRADAGVRPAHRRGLSLRRLPVLDRHAIRTAFSRRACSPATGRCRRTPRCRPRRRSSARRTGASSIYLSHADTRRAYEAYASYYLSTSGQRYWSDTHQLSVYLDDYHAELDRRLARHGTRAPK